MPVMEIHKWTASRLHCRSGVCSWMLNRGLMIMKQFNLEMALMGSVLPLMLSLLTRTWARSETSGGCSEVHLMERMLFCFSKVTFGSMSNGSFEDALDIRTAITADMVDAGSQGYCEICVVCWGIPGAAGCVCSDGHVMLDGANRMIVYRPAAESEVLTMVHEKAHIEKTWPGVDAVYLASRPVKMCDSTRVAMWVIEVHQGRMRSLSDRKVKF